MYDYLFLVDNNRLSFGDLYSKVLLNLPLISLKGKTYAIQALDITF